MKGKDVERKRKQLVWIFGSIAIFLVIAGLSFMALFNNSKAPFDWWGSSKAFFWPIILLVGPILIAIYQVKLLFKVLFRQENRTQQIRFDVFTLLYIVMCVYHMVRIFGIITIEQIPHWDPMNIVIPMRVMYVVLGFFFFVYSVVSYVLLSIQRVCFSTLANIMAITGLYMGLLVLVQLVYATQSYLLFAAYYAWLAIGVIGIIFVKAIVMTLHAYPVQKGVSLQKGWLRPSNDSRKWPVIALGIALLQIGCVFLI